MRGGELKKYYEVWNKLSFIVKKKFDSNPVYNQEEPKTKIKTERNLHEIPKEVFLCHCSSVIIIDSVFKMDQGYSCQVSLQECNYVNKEKKMPEYINNDIEISVDSDEENSDKENFDEEDYSEE